MQIQCFEKAKGENNMVVYLEVGKTVKKYKNVKNFCITNGVLKLNTTDVILQVEMIYIDRISIEGGA